MIRPLILALLVVLFSVPAHAQLDEIEKRMGVNVGPGLSESKIASGLKQALQVGSENAVKIVGKPNGYFGNPVIKIEMPKDLHLLESGMRELGFGPKIDEFILSMNRSAETAAPAARKIFIDAIFAMTFEDAKRILSGDNTAATQYFKEKTTGRLTDAFTPVVKRTMSENGVVKQYDSLTEQYKNIPFAKSQSLDIDHYVVSKALDGLFYELGEQEKQIRTNPAARTTDLLKDVFSHAGH
jgi:RecA/RadA recombinase